MGWLDVLYSLFGRPRAGGKTGTPRGGAVRELRAKDLIDASLEDTGQTVRWNMSSKVEPKPAFTSSPPVTFDGLWRRYFTFTDDGDRAAGQAMESHGTDDGVRLPDTEDSSRSGRGVGDNTGPSRTNAPEGVKDHRKGLGSRPIGRPTRTGADVNGLPDERVLPGRATARGGRSPDGMVPEETDEAVAVVDWLAAWLEDVGTQPPVGGDAAVQEARAAAGGALAEGLGDASVLIEGEFGASPGPGALAGHGDRPLLAGERLKLRELATPTTPAPDATALARTPPGGRPPDDAAYRALLHATYDAHKARLIANLVEEPLFAYARHAWVDSLPGVPPPHGAWTTNLAIFHAVFMRLSRLMGTIYDFDPAPLATVETAPGQTVASLVPAMPPGFIGWYDPQADLVYVAQRLLGGRIADLADTIAHEQLHAFHRAMIVKLRRGELTGAPRSLALSWDAEFERWTQRCDGLGLGYHAHDVGRTVGQVIRGLRRPTGMERRPPGA